MTATDPHGKGDAGITIKYGAGFDAPWYTPRGTNDELYEMLVDAYGLEPQNEDGTPRLLHELILEATKTAQAAFSVQATLGGTVVRSGGRGGKPAAWGNKAPAEPAPEPEPVDPLVQIKADIEATETVDALKRLYAENQALFADAETLAAWKAKGKALTAAVAA